MEIVLCDWKKGKQRICPGYERNEATPQGTGSDGLGASVCIFGPSFIFNCAVLPRGQAPQYPVKLQRLPLPHLMTTDGPDCD